MVNIWLPADVHLMGTWGLAELGYLHGKFSSKLQALQPFPQPGVILHLSFLLGHGFSRNVWECHISDTFTVLTDTFQTGQQA